MNTRSAIFRLPLSLIALITIALLLASCSSSGRRTLNKAEEALRQGDNTAALAHTTEALRHL